LYAQGVIADNFVGGMAQEDMQQFMMGFIMGTKPNEGAKLREGQLSPIQRRALTLRLQQAAGLSELGMTRRQQIAGKIDNMLMFKNVLTSEQQQSVQAVTAIKQAMKLVSTLTSNAASGLGEGELTKYNKINQAGKLYQTVLLQQPVALQLLKIAGFREKDGDEGFLVLSHRNIAVLTLVRDKADNFVKNVKLPVAATDDVDIDTVNDETTAQTAAAVHNEQQQQQHDVGSKQHSSSHIALMIDLTSDTSITIKDLSVDDTLDSVLKQINASCEVNSSDNDDDSDDNKVIALAARFPKGVFDAAKDGAKTLGELGIKSSTRLKAITVATSKQQQQQHASKSHKATTADSTDTTTAITGATVRKSPAVTVTVSTPKKKSGTLFGKDGLIKAKKGPIEHIGGGGTTVTLATADTTADDDDAATASSSSAPLKTQRKVKHKKSKKSSSSSSRHSSSNDKSAAEDL
jgi:PUB domain